MRVFLSYSSDQRPLAESINHLLLNEGHDVFFDRDDLPPGQTYGDRIRRGIDRCHLFVFLVSPGSLSAGSYALSELAILQNAARRKPPAILPVLAVSGMEDRIPPFLRPLTLFEPQGDAAAEIAAKVADVDRQRRRTRRLWIAAAVAGLLLCTVGLTTTAAGSRARGWLALVLPVAAPAPPAKVDRPPVLIASPGDREWSFSLMLPDYQAREIFYRFDGEPAFRSTGFERIPDVQTGLPQPRTYFVVRGLNEDRVLFVKFIDSAGRERGPYRLVFDLEAELVAYAKNLLGMSEEWVAFREWPDKNHHLVYFTHLLSYRSAITAIRYSFDDETLARSVRFTPDPSRSGLSRFSEQDEIYVDVPDGAKFVALQIRFIDGSQSPIKRFPVTVD